MKIHRIVGGTLEANCYIVYSEKNGKKEGLIIDPGYNPREILSYVEKEKIDVVAIVLTHLHRDHTSASEEIGRKLDIPIYMHRLDEEDYKGRVDITLDDKDEITFGDELLICHHSPGHTRGSICLRSPRSKVIFTGDTIFDIDLGRTDLAGGSEKDMKETVNKVINLWENDYYIYPGHDTGATMKQVRKYNREFLDLLDEVKSE